MVSGQKDGLPLQVEDKLRKLRFQLYTPRSEELKKFSQEHEETDHVLQQVMEKNRVLIKSANGKFMDAALDLDNMFPRKGHWERKKILSKKMDRLERRTRRAIVELARAKQAEGNNLTLATQDNHESSSDEE